MSYVRLERPEEHIGLITLDRPERYNALSFQLLRSQVDRLKSWQHLQELAGSI